MMDESARSEHLPNGWQRSWMKDVFFGLVVVGVGTSIAFSLLSSDRIENPDSFHPKGQFRKSVSLTASEVDLAFKQMWDRAKVTPAEPADNLTIARRLALGLAGTIPSLEEIRALEEIKPEDQVYWWVTRLLQDQRSSDHLAERYTRALVGVEEGPFLVFRRRRFAQWISEQLQVNRPYDWIVRDILTNEGIWTDEPAVNFYTRTISEETEQPDPILLAARTSRAFLGLRIDCLQCHDDFLGTLDLGDQDNRRGGLQTDFHALAAFYGQTKNSVLGIRDNNQSEPYQYQLLGEDSESKIEPKFPFHSELDNENDNLRKRLAGWVTHPDNRPFARSAVNRVWAIMTGRPLVTPVDHIPLTGPFPEALEVLVDDFIENKFNLRRLIHVISQTQAFQLSSVHPDEISYAHEDQWAVFPMVRLRPDQAAGSIAQSTQFATIDNTAHIITRLTSFGQINEFITRFGDPGEDEFEDRGETVTQRLLMLNGNMVSERLRTELNSCSLLAGLSPDHDTTLDIVYLATLTRRPTEEEKVHFKQTLQDKYGNDRKREVLDIYWSLLNSAEFRWNH